MELLAPRRISRPAMRSLAKKHARRAFGASKAAARFAAKGAARGSVAAAKKTAPVVASAGKAAGVVLESYIVRVNETPVSSKKEIVALIQGAAMGSTVSFKLVPPAGALSTMVVAHPLIIFALARHGRRRAVHRAS